LKNPDTRRRDELTPIGANTSRSFKCGQCGVMYSASDVLGSTQPRGGKRKKDVAAGRSPKRSRPESPSGCMTCPSCGFENCVGDATMIDASNEDY